MKYLILLNRFSFDISGLESKIKDSADNLKNFSFDEGNNRIILEADSIDHQKIRQLQEIKEVLPVNIGYKRFRRYFM